MMSIYLGLHYADLRLIKISVKLKYFDSLLLLNSQTQSLALSH